MLNFCWGKSGKRKAQNVGQKHHKDPKSGHKIKNFNNYSNEQVQCTGKWESCLIRFLLSSQRNF